LPFFPWLAREYFEPPRPFFDTLADREYFFLELYFDLPAPFLLLFIQVEPELIDDWLEPLLGCMAAGLYSSFMSRCH
jgi:hypothetical protein